MVLGFMAKFPNGQPTYFEEKLNLQPMYVNEMYIGKGGNTRIVKKIHTIREDKSGRWKAGNSVQGYYYPRTSRMKKIFDGECVSIQYIEIKYEQGLWESPKIYVSRDNDNHYHELSIDEMCRLAWNDGFENLSDFMSWFNEDFEGKIIHFTDLKY